MIREWDEAADAGRSWDGSRLFAVSWRSDIAEAEIGEREGESATIERRGDEDEDEEVDAKGEELADTKIQEDECERGAIDIDIVASTLSIDEMVFFVVV